MSTFQLIITCSIGLVLAGCSRYGHVRTMPDGSTETTRFTAFVQKIETQALATRVSDRRGTNSYTRSVGVDAWQQRGDKELFQAGTEVGFSAAAAYFTGGASQARRPARGPATDDEWGEPLPPRAGRRRAAPAAPNLATPPGALMGARPLDAPGATNQPNQSGTPPAQP